MTHKCVQILEMGGVTAYCEKVYVEDILCQVLLFDSVKTSFCH